MTRIAFLTISQSPRDDLIPDLVAQIGGDNEAVEFGVLDGLSDSEISALAPRGEDLCLVSRLNDGRETTLSKGWVEGALQAKLDAIDGQGFDLIVLLCTGSFPMLHSKTLMVEAGRVVDHFVEALDDGGRKIGVMVPNADQVGNFQRSAGDGARSLYTHASPYTDRRFDAAARELGEADFIVMHCMGYDGAMRQQVAAVSGRPVVLSRNVVADAVRQLA